MPKQVVKTAVELPVAFTDCQEPLVVDHELADGDSVDIGPTLSVVDTPSHAPGSVCFVSARDAMAFTGDHVLGHISPNPLLTIAPGTEDDRTRSLPLYLDSLEKIQDVDADAGYGGHGEWIAELDSRVEEILDHHHSRKERIADLIETISPITAYAIMQELFPDLPATEVIPGMSEVIGHLDVLEDDGRVEIIERDGVRQYAQL